MNARVLIVDDERTFRLVAETALAAEGLEVRSAANGREALRLSEELAPDLVILDRNLPDCDGLTLLARFVEPNRTGRPPPLVLMATAYAEVEHAVQALKLGAYDYLTKPLQLPELTHKVKVALRTRKLEQRVERLEKTLGSGSSRDIQLGESAAMKRVAELVEAVAQSPETTVLIEGESGTGKQIVARLIHERTASQSAARGGEPAPPFVELNAAALPEQFVESELFGHERGAFTDAKGQKLGLLELADGGSLFLDEIAELPASAQAKLLKVLETGTFRRLGGIGDVRVKLRFIAATHSDLAKGVRAGSFREDLFHRLDVFRIQVPPLRERPADLLPLARGFVREFAERMGKHTDSITPEAEALLAAYRYPGNVRELRNVIERAVILETGETLSASSILLNQSQPPSGAETLLQRSLALRGRPPTLAEVERDYIEELLRHTGGNKSSVARLMGVSFPTVARKIAEYAIVLPE